VNFLFNFVLSLFRQRLRDRDPERYEKFSTAEMRIERGIFRAWIYFGSLVLIGVVIYLVVSRVACGDCRSQFDSPGTPTRPAYARTD
jgi:hypothetical protein